MSLVEVRNLSVSFAGRRGSFLAVDNVSFAVERGRTLALVGESGCGKTMTALGILRLTPEGSCADAEAVRIGDTDVSRLGDRQLRPIRGHRMAMIFQEPLTALNPLFRVGEQIAETLRLHVGLGRRDAWSRAVEQLREVGVPGAEQRARQYPHELSGGMRQRAMIGMAICCRPAFLIADEPTTALDVTVQAEIIDLLMRIQSEQGMALLLITHDLGVVAETAHDVAVMYAGRIVEQADAVSLFHSPLHPYTQDLLASVPSMMKPSEDGRLAPIPGTVPDLAHLPDDCAYAPRCSRATDECAHSCDLRKVAAGRWVRCVRAKEWLP